MSGVVTFSDEVLYLHTTNLIYGIGAPQGTGLDSPLPYTGSVHPLSLNASSSVAFPESIMKI